MKVWKQLLLCVIVLVAAVAAWVYFVPSSREVLARWGIDWAVAATPPASGGNQANAQGSGNRHREAPSVVALPVATATINDKLQAIGSGRANATVSVAPYSAGRLVEFVVQSGAHVEKGDVLARLDSETEEIALDRARVTRDSSKAKFERYQALRQTNTASQVQLTDAELELRTAELQVHDAEVALDRRTVKAPISGIVGILPIENGNYVTTSSNIATIDDRSSILVDFWVPERFASSVQIGSKIEATPLANPQERFEGQVSAIDNRIDEKSRTLYVRATIANPADSLRAGMSFDITMAFPGQTYPAVSPLAIQWGTDGAFIWAVEGGKAQRVPVRIVQRNTENVLIQADISNGDLVVTEGTQNLRAGDEIKVANAGAQNQANAAGASAQ